ncbi:hypothetical protein FRC09_014269, partial [Ceratobasidium sp. 395]
MSRSPPPPAQTPPRLPEQVHPRPADPAADAEIFGRLLGENHHVVQPLRLDRPAEPDHEMRAGQENDEEEENSAKDKDRGGEDDGDDGELGQDVQAEDEDEAEMFVPPIEFEVHPEDPDEGGEGAAFAEHPMLRNIYVRVWVQAAFQGATHEAIQSSLKSHQLALLAGVDLGNFPEELRAQILRMPTTLRALERRLGVNFSDLITIYPVCPTCSKRYTCEQLLAFDNPQSDGSRKRTPTKSFPYSSIIAALGYERQYRTKLRALAQMGEFPGIPWNP